MYDRQLMKKEKKIISLEKINDRLTIENQELKKEIKNLELEIEKINSKNNNELREEMISAIQEYKNLCLTIKDLKKDYEDNLKDIKIIKKNFIKDLQKIK